MTCSFPRSYAVVRHGRRETVSIADPEALIALRTELEIVRRFGAGAKPGLVEAIDRRIREQSSRAEAIGSRGAELAELQDMRLVLSDSLAPATGQAIAEIDRDFPQARAGVVMDTIKNEADAFHKDVVDELQGAGDADVDALLAEFAEATQEVTGEAGEAVDELLDSDLQALLAETSGESPEEAALAALAAQVDQAENDADPNDDVTAMLEELGRTADGATDPAEEAVEQSEAAVEPAELSAEQGLSSCSEPVDLEAVTDHVAESLSTAEAQLDAIASAFEVAAAELGGADERVAQTTGASGHAFVAAEDEVTAAAEWDTRDARADGSPAVGDDAAVAALPAIPTSRSAAEELVSWTGATPQAATPVSSCSSAEPRAADRMRTQLKQARANILAELDDLLVMLERVDQMQVQADQSLFKARQFEQAAAKAQAAGQALAAAEAEASKARAAFEEAQARVSGARQSWQQAQHEAATAAGRTGTGSVQ